MVECVYRTQMPTIPAKVNWDITPEHKKKSIPNFELKVPFMVPDLVYKLK
jgi:hypothetical protein